MQYVLTNDSTDYLVSLTAQDFMEIIETNQQQAVHQAYNTGACAGAIYTIVCIFIWKVIKSYFRTINNNKEKEQEQ